MYRSEVSDRFVGAAIVCRLPSSRRLFRAARGLRLARATMRGAGSDVRARRCFFSQRKILQNQRRTTKKGPTRAIAQIEPARDMLYGSGACAAAHEPQKAERACQQRQRCGKGNNGAFLKAGERVIRRGR